MLCLVYGIRKHYFQLMDVWIYRVICLYSLRRSEPFAKQPQIHSYKTLFGRVKIIFVSKIFAMRDNSPSVFYLGRVTTGVIYGERVVQQDLGGGSINGGRCHLVLTESVTFTNTVKFSPQPSNSTLQSVLMEFKLVFFGYFKLPISTRAFKITPQFRKLKKSYPNCVTPNSSVVVSSKAFKASN